MMFSNIVVSTSLVIVIVLIAVVIRNYISKCKYNCRIADLLFEVKRTVRGLRCSTEKSVIDDLAQVVSLHGYPEITVMIDESCSFVKITVKNLRTNEIQYSTAVYFRDKIEKEMK